MLCTSPSTLAALTKPNNSPADVRARISKIITEGKTVVLSSAELDDPSIREQLPQLLEEIAQEQGTQTCVGPSIPGHTLLGEIGQGGMSTVYLARQDKLGRHVAIKIAPSWLGSNERAQQMLLQEAHTMARLRHPNIVVIHDIINVNEAIAISMDWVDGRTLASLLRTLPDRTHPDDMQLLRVTLGTKAGSTSHFADTPHRHFAQLIRDIARATQVVHDNQLLHLDIKPSNVLVRRDGTPLLADFGVTRDIRLETSYTRTFAGTPVYAAPEQLRRNDKKIGPHTDVYSLGITLYEALARTQPLKDMDMGSIAGFIESGSMPKLSRYGTISRDLENIVHKAISPEPENRYRTASELADDLSAYLEDRPVRARPLRLSQRIRRRVHHEPWKAGLALALSVALPLAAGLGIYLAMQWPSIEAAEAAYSQIQADGYKHEAYQLWLTNQEKPSQAIELLKQATTLDPSGSSVACLLALANEEGWQVASTAVEDYEQDYPSLGMRLFAKKVAERRSFFSDEEVSELRNSDAISDLYLVALDQSFRAHDDKLETSAALAQQYLEEASFRAEGDPLLLGLIGWFAARAQDRERFDSSVRSTWQRWPHDAMALAWGALSIEQIDSDRAKQLARKIIDAMPREPRGYELLAAAESRTGRHQAATEILAEASTANLKTPITHHLALRLRAANGDTQAVIERRQQAEDDRDILAQLHAQESDQLEPKLELIQKILAMPTPSPRMLAAAFFNAMQDQSWNDKLWARHAELYPERRRIHTARFFSLVKRKDYISAAELGKDFESPINQIEVLAPWQTRCFLLARDYEQLVRSARRWSKVGQSAREAFFYQAIGHARLHQHDLASQQISRCLHATAEGKSWYVQALLEDALLRCATDTPEHLRDPDLAMTRMREFEERNPALERPHEGPWTRRIRGEVLLANGQIDRAIEQFQLGLRKRQRREVIAPEDYRDQLTKALARAKARKKR
jgi:serine/threonine protein kinase